MDKFTFEDKEYDQESLSAMEESDLLALRNKIAGSLGVAEIKSFKDKETGVTQTLKALEKASKEAEKPKTEKKAKAKKEPKEKKPRGIPKSAEPKEIKRPTRRHFATIEKVGEHDGTGKHGRPERWPNYTDGMTIADVIEGNGTEPWDVYNWEKHGIMKVHEPTDDEYAERRAAWFKAKDRVDPEVEKAEKAKAREKAKQEKEAAEAAETESAE